MMEKKIHFSLKSKRNRLLIAFVSVAALLWFIMFSPWTKNFVNFWYMMTFSGVVLICIERFANKKHHLYKKPTVKTVAAGIAIAGILYGIFFVGYELSRLILDFARMQVEGIYTMKGNTSEWFIGLALLFIIGPAEEMFWRGYVQRSLMKRLGGDKGFFVTLAIYTLIHIWSLNLMLIGAAAVCGFCWGVIYRANQKMLPALVISHALWDVAAFVLMPFA